jgi:membrane associated rhomboid family serine protease
MIPIRDTLSSRRFPVLTIGLIVINLFVFLYQGYLSTRTPYFDDWTWVQAAWEIEHLDPPPTFQTQRVPLPYSRTGTIDMFSIPRDEVFVNQYGLIASEFLHGVDLPPTLPIPIWLTLLTSMFLHGGLLHLLGNMLYLWIFGDNIEDAMGPLRFLLFYLLCGVIASLSQIAIDPGSSIPSIGASGAIAGVLAAYFMLFPHSRVLTLIPIFFFLRLISIPAVVLLGFWFVLQVISGAGSLGSEGGVAWFAHIGGFVAGAILVFPFRRKSVPVVLWRMILRKRY